AIFGLEVGQVSDPVREGDYGFHIFRVDRRIPAQPLEAVREELRSTLLEAPPTEAEIAVVEQILRQRIPVTVFDVPARPSSEDDE
ncbi:MAG: peptidylprolyl isomerase, partial [Planctomycetota bacterium]